MLFFDFVHLNLLGHAFGGASVREFPASKDSPCLGVSLIAGLAGYLLLEVLHLRNDWVSCIAGVLGVCCVYGTSMGIPAMEKKPMYALGTIKESLYGAFRRL